MYNSRSCCLRSLLFCSFLQLLDSLLLLALRRFLFVRRLELLHPPQLPRLLRLSSLRPAPRHSLLSLPLELASLPLLLLLGPLQLRAPVLARPTLPARFGGFQVLLLAPVPLLLEQVLLLVLLQLLLLRALRQLVLEQLVRVLLTPQLLLALLERLLLPALVPRPALLPLQLLLLQPPELL